MYAVIKAGGHQYRVQQGDVIAVDSMAGNVGDSVTFNEVLFVGGDKPKAGAPTVRGASVAAKIKGQERSPKVIIFKYKRRKNYKRTRGHKQPYTLVEIGNITA